jgi:hypothetical protein
VQTEDGRAVGIAQLNPRNRPSIGQVHQVGLDHGAKLVRPALGDVGELRTSEVITTHACNVIPDH